MLHYYRVKWAVTWSTWVATWLAITALTIRFSFRLLSDGCCGWVLLLRSAFRNACDIYKWGLCRPAFSAVELEGCCNGAPATTSGFISKHVSESTQNFESGGSFPRGSAERVNIWIRDDGVLDAGQRDPLTYVRRIYMRFDIALAQLLGGGGCFAMLLQRE
jgi:hypothetical protein